MSKPYKYVKLSDNGHAIIEVKTRLGLYYENAFRGPSLFVKRIVSCLNACEGIEDPAEFRKVFGEMKEALKDAVHDKMSPSQKWPFEVANAQQLITKAEKILGGKES